MAQQSQKFYTVLYESWQVSCRCSVLRLQSQALPIADHIHISVAQCASSSFYPKPRQRRLRRTGGAPNKLQLCYCMSFLSHIVSMAISLSSTEGDQLCETGTYELPILHRVSDRLQYHQLRHTRANPEHIGHLISWMWSFGEHKSNKTM